MDNPAGYLYRVGQSKARRSLGRSRRVVLPPALPAEESAWVEPGLPKALGRLPVKQRAAVIVKTDGLVAIETLLHRIQLIEVAGPDLLLADVAHCLGPVVSAIISRSCYVGALWLS